MAISAKKAFQLGSILAQATTPFAPPNSWQGQFAAQLAASHQAGLMAELQKEAEKKAKKKKKGQSVSSNVGMMFGTIPGAIAGSKSGAGSDAIPYAMQGGVNALNIASGFSTPTANINIQPANQMYSPLSRMTDLQNDSNIKELAFSSGMNSLSGGNQYYPQMTPNPRYNPAYGGYGLAVGGTVTPVAEIQPEVIQYPDGTQEVVAQPQAKALPVGTTVAPISGQVIPSSTNYVPPSGVDTYRVDTARNNAKALNQVQGNRGDTSQLMEPMILPNQQAQEQNYIPIQSMRQPPRNDMAYALAAEMIPRMLSSQFNSQPATYLSGIKGGDVVGLTPEQVMATTESISRDKMAVQEQKNRQEQLNAQNMVAQARMAGGYGKGKGTSGFTLGEGQARYDESGNLIAKGPEKRSKKERPIVFGDQLLDPNTYDVISEKTNIKELKDGTVLGIVDGKITELRKPTKSEKDLLDEQLKRVQIQKTIADTENAKERIKIAKDKAEASGDPSVVKELSSIQNQISKNDMVLRGKLEQLSTIGQDDPDYEKLKKEVDELSSRQSDLLVKSTAIEQGMANKIAGQSNVLGQQVQKVSDGKYVFKGTK